MKKTRKRNASKDRSFSRLTEPGSAADEVLVLAELRATRDDPVLTVTPLDNLPDDKDAIDRLLVVSGFEHPITSIVQTEDMTSRSRAEQVTVLPDAATDRAEAAAFRVVPLAATQPPGEVEPELFGLGLKVDSHDADGDAQRQAFFFAGDAAKSEPDGQAVVVEAFVLTEPDLWAADLAATPLQDGPDFEPVPIATAETPPMFEDFAETETAMPVLPVVVDDEACPVGLEAEQTMATEPDLWGEEVAVTPLRVEPIVEPVPIAEADMLPLFGGASETETVLHPLDDAAKPLAADDWLPHSELSEAALSPPASSSAERCEYKTEQARINTVTLILSIVASLSALVLYFLLMDMKNDVLKLNEMVEIMKEDIQAKHDEPPAE